MKSPSAATRGRRALLGKSLSALLYLATPAAALAAEPLPDPLTLDYALTLAATADATVQAAAADVALAQAQQQDAAADNAVQAALQGRAMRIDPSRVAADQGRDDSSISLVVRKPLFDFGRSRAGDSAALADRQSSEWRLLDSRQQRRLTIMAAYYAVLLAELTLERDAAALALADGVFRSAVARQQLGQISRIDRGAAEESFLAAKRQQLASAARLQAARGALADTLGTPGQLPASLTEPTHTALERSVPPLATVQGMAQAHNPLLLAQRARVEAALQRVQAARAGRLPVLTGELAASSYARQTDERDDWHAGVTLEVPLYTGGKTQAAIAARQAELQRCEAEYAQASLSLTHALQAALDDLAGLQVQREQARVRLDYRTLALQRSQGLHGNQQDDEIDADRAQLAAAKLFRAQTEFQLAYAWARLDAMLGGSADSNAPIGDAATPLPLKH